MTRAEVKRFVQLHTTNGITTIMLKEISAVTLLTNREIDSEYDLELDDDCGYEIHLTSGTIFTTKDIYTTDGNLWLHYWRLYHK